MIIGPFPTVVISAIALFFQTFIGHGGITTIGANTFSMGIVGTFTGFLTFWALRKAGASIWLSAGMGGLVGDLMTYVTSSLRTGNLNPPRKSGRLVGNIYCSILADADSACHTGVWVYSGCGFNILQIIDLNC